MTDDTTHDVTKETTLRHLYYEEKMSIGDIASKLDCTRDKVRYWMDKHDVERRSQLEAIRIKNPVVKMSTGAHGYERFQHQHKNESFRVQHHRLLAVAEYGIDSIDGKVIHHKNEIPWDNRIENIEPMTRAEHASEHSDGIPISEQLAMFALYESSDLTHREVAEMFDKSTSNVTTVVKRVRDNGVNSTIA